VDIIAITAGTPGTIDIIAILGTKNLPAITGTAADTDSTHSRGIGTTTAIMNSHTAGTTTARIGHMATIASADITATTVGNLPTIGITTAITVTATECTASIFTTSSLIIAITATTGIMVAIAIIAMPSIAAIMMRNALRIIATTTAALSTLATVKLDLTAALLAITATDSPASVMAITNRADPMALVRTRSAPAVRAAPVDHLLLADHRPVIVLRRHRTAIALQTSSGSWITSSASSRNYGKR
jgi:hypothetical protein